MKGVSGVPGRAVRGVGLAFVALAITASARGESPKGRRAFFSPDPWRTFVAGAAIEGARERLERAECRLVYSDFRDASGRSLQAVLEERGQTAGENFSAIGFDGGDGLPPCRVERTLAFTSPGARVVHVCTRQFANAFREDPDHAVATLIHEQLHTLGLGENPPTSLEITRRVLERCAR